MIDGMSEICIDCVHQEVCKYECYCPSGHCNDYAVADDFRPQGKWILCEDTYFSKCSICGDIWLNEECGNYCSNCGARMNGGAE